MELLRDSLVLNLARPDSLSAREHTEFLAKLGVE
jgi:hypothetical protein